MATPHRGAKRTKGSAELAGPIEATDGARVWKRARPSPDGKGSQLRYRILDQRAQASMRRRRRRPGVSQHRPQFQVARVVETKRQQAPPPFARAHTHTHTGHWMAWQMSTEAVVPGNATTVITSHPSPRKKIAARSPARAHRRDAPSIRPCSLFSWSKPRPPPPPTLLCISQPFSIRCWDAPFSVFPSSALHRCLHSCLAQLN